MLSLFEVESPVIIEKHLGPLRTKFNTKQTRINLSEVESKFIAIRHVSAAPALLPASERMQAGMMQLRIPACGLPPFNWLALQYLHRAVS